MPADTFASTCTFFAPSYQKQAHLPRSLSEHIPSLVRSTSCTRSQTHTHAPSPFPSTRCCPPSCAAWTEAMSSCQTGGSRVLPHPHHSLVASPSQLTVQQPRRPSQAGHQKRRRQWHQDPVLASGHGAPRRRPPRPTRPPRCPIRPSRPQPPRPKYPTNDSARDSPIASFTPPPVLRAPSNTASGRLAHARVPRAAARRAALERARERPGIPPRPADAAAPGRGAVGRVC